MELKAEGQSQCALSEQTSSTQVSNSSEGNSIDKMTSSNDTSSFQTLRVAIEKSINRLTSKNRIFPYFKEHFQTIYRKDSKNVVELYKSMMDQLKVMIIEEIDLQLHCNEVKQRLGEIDSLKKEERVRRKIWRPSGNAHEDLKAHLEELNETELKNLEKIYKSLLSKNKLLNESVTKAQQHVESTEQQLDKFCNEWEEGASAIPESVRQDIVKIALDLPTIIKSDDVCLN